MCINPITIRIKPSDLARRASLPPSLLSKRTKGFCEAYLRSYRPARFSELYEDILPRPNQSYTVSCGRCVECLRARQDDIATRCAFEAQSKGSMCFLTLTYNDSSVPLSHFFRTYDTETGEYLSRSDFQVFHANSLDIELSKSLLASQLRERFHRIKSSPSPRYIELSPDTPDGMSDLGIDEYSVDIFTPSLCRHDVRMWLKSSRVAYEREFGHKCSDFTYVICGEYGPKSCRPHYHCIFFGAKLSEIRFFAKRWADVFGFFNLKKVNAVNKDGSSGFVICSKYVGKYISKGNFECPSVLNRHAEKPRLMISKHLGLSALTPSLVEYFRASDLLGKIDLMSLKYEDGVSVSRSDVQYLREEVLKRAHITLPGGKAVHRLPRSYKRKIWYFKDIFYESPSLWSFRSSSLWRAINAVAPPDSSECFVSSILERFPNISKRAFLSILSSFESCKEASRLSRYEHQKCYLTAQYGKSVF